MSVWKAKRLQKTEIVRMIRHYSSGQTLTEYTLAAGLVALVAIGALTFLASSTSDNLPGLLDRIFGDGGGSPSGGAVVAGVSEVRGTRTVELVLSNGTTITLQDYPAEVGELVEAAGANGGTKIMASRLEDLAHRLLDAGEIDEAQARLLIDLANRGHRIGEVEGVLETAVADPDFDIHNTQGEGQLVFEGQAYRPMELAKKIGYSSPFGTDLFHQSAGQHGSMGADLKSFVDLYREAEASGAMRDPVVEAVVSDLVRQIGYTAQEFTTATEHLVYRISQYEYDDQGNQTNHYLMDKEHFIGRLASNLSHRSSGGICSSGGGEDSGIRCQ